MDLFACIRNFVLAAEAGSFAAASPTAGVSPAMLGRQVAWLEDRLGAQLLSRTTRRQSLTEAGRIYLDRARTVLAELEAAEASVALMRATPRGVLRIGAPVTFGSRALAPALPDFLAAYPQMRVELLLDNRLVDPLEEGLDLVIRTGALPDSPLIARALGPYRLVACAAPAYLTRRGTPQTPAELAGHACLGFHPGSSAEAWTFAEANGAALSVRVAGPFAANHGEALRAAALAGCGIVFQAEALLAEDLAAGRLVPVLASFMPPPLPMHALYPAGRAPLPKLRAFVDFLVARYGRDDWALALSLAATVPPAVSGRRGTRTSRTRGTKGVLR